MRHVRRLDIVGPIREAQLFQAYGSASPRRICQGLRLDEQTLSFVAAAGPAESHDNSVSGAPCFRPSCDQGIARWQILKIVETNAAKASRTGGLHHQEIAGAAAPMARPLAVQWLDNHQFRGSVCPLRQTLTLLLGKFGRDPMGPI
jgi:hypothetical protein